MSSAVLAPLALAGAVLVAPVSGRRRLARRPSPRARSRTRGIAATAVLIPGMLVLLGVGGVLLCLTVIVLAATLWHRRRQQRARMVAAAAAGSMEAALEVLISELRVGAHPIRAFEAAAAECDGAVGSAFRAVAARARLGGDVPSALRAAGSAVGADAAWERLAVFWELAADHGLAIAALMRAAQTDLVERQRFTAQVLAGMAGARATAAILAGLPVLGVGLGQLIGAQPVAFLIGSTAGGWCLLLGVVLVCGGLLWADRITGGVLR